MAELEIRNLHVSVEDKEILRGLDLDVEKGKVHGGVAKALSGTTLADLVEFAGQDRKPAVPAGA